MRAFVLFEKARWDGLEVLEIHHRLQRNRELTKNTNYVQRNGFIFVFSFRYSKQYAAKYRLELLLPTKEEEKGEEIFRDLHSFFD